MTLNRLPRPGACAGPRRAATLVPYSIPRPRKTLKVFQNVPSKSLRGLALGVGNQLSQRKGEGEPAAAPAKADNRRRGRSGGGSSRQPQEFFRTITLSIIRYTTTTHFQNECSGSLLCGIQKVAIVAKKGGARTDKIRWLFVEPGLKMLRSKCCNSYTPGDKTGFTYAFQPLVGSQFSLLAGQHAPPPHAGIFSVHRETVAGTGHRVHRKSSQSEKPYIYI